MGEIKTGYACRKRNKKGNFLTLDLKNCNEGTKTPVLAHVGTVER